MAEVQGIEFSCKKTHGPARAEALYESKSSRIIVYPPDTPAVTQQVLQLPAQRYHDVKLDLANELRSHFNSPLCKQLSSQANAVCTPEAWSTTTAPMPATPSSYEPSVKIKIGSVIGTAYNFRDLALSFQLGDELHHSLNARGFVFQHKHARMHSLQIELTPKHIEHGLKGLAFSPRPRMPPSKKV